MCRDWCGTTARTNICPESAPDSYAPGAEQHIYSELVHARWRCMLEASEGSGRRGGNGCLIMSAGERHSSARRGRERPGTVPASGLSSCVRRAPSRAHQPRWGSCNRGRTWPIVVPSGNIGLRNTAGLAAPTTHGHTPRPTLYDPRGAALLTPAAHLTKAARAAALPTTRPATRPPQASAQLARCESGARTTYTRFPYELARLFSKDT